MASAFVPPNVVKVNGVWQIEGKPREEIEVLQTYHPSNLPGKTLLVCHISIPPNGGTPPHRHGGAVAVAFPYAGSSINQMNSQPPKAYGPGEFWYEGPGCHHQRSDNAVTEEGGEVAKFFAVLIVDDEVVENGDFFVLDKEVEVGERKASK